MKCNEMFRGGICHQTRAGARKATENRKQAKNDQVTVTYKLEYECAALVPVLMSYLLVVPLSCVFIIVMN